MERGRDYLYILRNPTYLTYLIFANKQKRYDLLKDNNPQNMYSNENIKT